MPRDQLDLGSAVPYVPPVVDNHHGIGLKDSLKDRSSGEEKYFVLALMKINHDIDKERNVKS